ncbi:Bcr/CflA family drug resistance efflux transporter [Agaricicola taiwanensis]|uniref:Bcr/CflA family efflux transporter n=1 Tax=Agaricicola taiwanensis TaxID=591372 RepID=A0A8J2VPB5_9RHOB|nr:multidrug effflux MFS transporter [Agaricicola taiwanensis]GGE37399.1 Bcr/CflA family drug resistance efflux transporter [Agaricicola taiwanensis]
MRRPGLFVLVAISAINPLSLNIVQPAIPGFAVTFATDYATAQLTLTAYLLSFALSQLLHGSLSDRYGRRPVVLGGFVVFLIGTLACGFANSIEELIASRVLQAAGGCAGFVLARAIVRDIHGQAKAASQLGYITTVMVVAPMLAPAMGGFLDAELGWRGIFAFLGLAGGVVLLIALSRLHETRAPVAPGTGPGFIGAFGILMRNRLFVAHSATLAATAATFFSFLGGAPYVVVTLQGQPPSTYGLYFIIGSFGYMVGNFIAGRTAERVGALALIRYGTALAVFGAVSMAAAQWMWPQSPLALFLPMLPLSIAQGLTLPSVTASAVSVRPDLAGAAAGLSGAVQLGFSAFCAWTVAHLLDQTSWPLVAVMLITTIGALIAGKVAHRFAESDPRGRARSEISRTLPPQ